MIAVWLILGASIGLAVASLIHTAAIGQMRAKFERVSSIVAERVLSEIEPLQSEQEAKIRRLASALGWSPELEDVDRFVARAPIDKTTPSYLTPTGDCVGDLAAACAAWQVTDPGTLQAAHDAHASAAATTAREMIQ